MDGYYSVLVSQGSRNSTAGLGRFLPIIGASVFADDEESAAQKIAEYVIAHSGADWSKPAAMTDADFDNYFIECFEAETVDLDDDKWANDTPGRARLERFQAHDIADLDGGLVATIGDFDVIYLPSIERAARVSNGDAEWFDARSFEQAIDAAL